MLRSIIQFLYGVVICWLLNLVQLAVALVLLASSDKLLATVYVLTTALGIVQIGYVVPISRLLWRKGRREAAYGVLAAAIVSALANAVIDILFGSRAHHSLR